MNEIENVLNELKQSKTATERAEALETCIRNLTEEAQCEGVVDLRNIYEFLKAAAA